MTLESLQPLLQELDAYKKADLIAELWWRDDNGAEPSVELDRLIGLSNRLGVPCGLAVVPAETGEPLRKAVSDAAHVWVLQHGTGAEQNAAPHRPKSVVLDELRQGMLKLNQLFKDRFVPVLVPHWDRIDSELLPYLPVMGYRGFSSIRRDPRPVPPGDLRMADVYCDLIIRPEDGEPRFAGSGPCVEALVNHLRDKRTGQADEAEPTGLRSHHTDMDGEAWEFLEDLLNLTAAHPAARWLSPAAIWTPSE